MKAELAMVCITAIEITLIVTKQDGTTLSPVFVLLGALGGIAGWSRIKKVVVDLCATTDKK